MKPNYQPTKDEMRWIVSRFNERRQLPFTEVTDDDRDMLHALSHKCCVRQGYYPQGHYYLVGKALDLFVSVQLSQLLETPIVVC